MIEAAIEEAKRTGDYAGVVRAIPYMQYLGIVLEIGDDGALCRMPENRDLIGNPLLPALHGGVVGALLESAAIVQLIWARQTVEVPKTIDITIDYLRSAKPVDTYAQGVVTKLGRRIANVRVEAWQNDREKPVAAAHAHFLLA